MIKNIVFDMGNVLLDYNPEVSLSMYVNDDKDRNIIRKELFGGKEWLLRDRGVMTDDEAFESIKKRVDKRLWKPLRDCLDNWQICMKPLPGAIEFVEKMRVDGYKIFILSNASTLFYEYFPNFKPLEYFDGIVISADVHMLKPEKEIYNYFLEKYELNPEECIFIDDRLDNVQGAIDAGMKAVRFKGNFDEIKI